MLTDTPFARQASTAMRPVVVQARAVGNAVFLEHPGCCGDIAAWGMTSNESASEVATAINKAIAEAVTAAVVRTDPD